HVGGEDTVAQLQRAVVEDAAALEGGRVVGEGAVAHLQRASAFVVNAAAVDGGVFGEGAVAQRQRAAVVDAAAEDGRVAVGEGQAGEGDGGVQGNAEDVVVATGVAAHRQHVGARPLDVDVTVQIG